MVKRHKEKVFVGLSGGVDSSVSAALLKEAGFAVTGVFIKVWQPDMALTGGPARPSGVGGCTWREDRLDAMRVCAKLDIPFFTLDLEKEYKKEVVDYMIDEYKKGRTPNPDVMCNKYIKFGGFFDWAMARGADYVATGHYARIKGGKLLAGKDKNKDQSYFLWTLTQKQISKTMFPIGHLEKPQVRKLAKKFGLETAEKKDSQGVCFIGKIEMADFLKNFIQTKKGVVLNETGEVIGHHEGVELFTIGQRHGFIITDKTNNDDRYFVVSKDAKKNTLTVSPNIINTNEISNQEIKLENVNWTLGQAPDLKKEYSARIRYRQPLEKCDLKAIGSDLLIRFKKPAKSPAPGQSVVIYDNEICLGGGIIK